MSQCEEAGAINPEATTVTTTTTTSTTIKATNDIESVPLRFSLLGLSTAINDISGFKNSMTQELEMALTRVAEDMGLISIRLQSNLVAMSSVSVFDRGLSIRNLQDESSESRQTIKLYYDFDVVKEQNQRYGPMLIQAIRDRRDEVLRSLQASTNYYISQFDLCTTSSAGLYDDSDFDICTLNHEIIPVSFSVSKPHPNIDADDLTQTVLDVYVDVLESIDGLEVANINVKLSSKTSSTLDISFNVDIIDIDGRNWKTVIERELQSEATKNKIVDNVNAVIIDLFGTSEGVQVCIDNEVLTMDCAAVKSKNATLPRWAIIAIATVSSAIVLCVIISMCVCAYQDHKDEQVYNIKAFVEDPEIWRQKQLQEEKKKREKRRKAVHSRSRDHQRKRRRHRSLRKMQYRRYSPQMRRSSHKVKRRGSHEKQKQLALPPPQYGRPQHLPVLTALPASPPVQNDRPYLV